MFDSQLDVLAGLFEGYFSGANHLRVASIFLMLLAFVLFLLLVIVIYIRSMISFLKSDKNTAKKKASSDKIGSLYGDDDDDLELNKRYELELEKELERELELSRAIVDNKAEVKKTAEATQIDLFNIKSQEEKASNTVKEETSNIEKEKNSNIEKVEISSIGEILSKKNNPKIVVDFDWKKTANTKDTSSNVDSLSTSFNSTPGNFLYTESKKDFSDLLGLLIDMVGRGVDDVKIGQALMYRGNGKNSEEDVMQTIDSVKDFIALCVNGKFNNIVSDDLPGVKTALYHLANGDSSAALLLMERLLDDSIEKANAMPVGPKKDEVYAEVSHHACTFGNLASINDVMLATGSFELAIELAPNNINAWNRVGDMYLRADSTTKAVWAYNNVLQMSDEDLNIRQIANASKHLSDHYYSKGDSLQAAKMHNVAKQFYDDLGIGERLGKQEIEIVEIIEANQGQDLELTIESILLNQNLRQYSYAQ